MPLFHEAINCAEAIFLPFFDSKLYDASQISIHCDNGTYAELHQMWDCCAVKGRGRRFILRWEGIISMQGYDSLRCFFSFPEAMVLNGWSVIDGKRVELFNNVHGNRVPVEPTSPPLCREETSPNLNRLEFEFIQRENTDIICNLYWIGFLSNHKERLLDPPLVHPQNWVGLLKSNGNPGIINPWITTRNALEQVKVLIDEPKFHPLREQLEREIKVWQDYEPEKHLREYLPVEEHLYRYARIRDRGRPPWDCPVMMLSLAGYLFDDPKWTQLAARILLCMAWTPKWFEGPQACFGPPKTGWHHACFVEAHNLVGALFAIQFIGDSLTAAGRKRVIERIEEAWRLVNAKCEEPGYRWFMNQGVVFNAARLAGAVGLWCETREKHYRSYVEYSYQDYCTVIENYVAPDGHFCEGPHYFIYSMNHSVAGWLAYAALCETSLENILPPGLRAAGTYLEAITTTMDRRGACIPLCASGMEEWPSGLLSLFGKYCGWKNSSQYLYERWKDKFNGLSFSVWDILLLPLIEDRHLSAATTQTRSAAIHMPSGLACFSWQAPKSGKFVITAERHSPGHHHFDRGGIILEAGGCALLPDPGMTNYSYPRNHLMKGPDWHNLAHPSGLPMRCQQRHDLSPAAPKLDFSWVEATSCEFRIDLCPIYQEVGVLKALRYGTLYLDRKNDAGVLVLFDEWEFDRPQEIHLTFQNYFPWSLAEGEIMSSGDGRIHIVSREINTDVLKKHVLSDRVDWNFRQMHTLKITTKRTLKTLIKSEITFALDGHRLVRKATDT